MNTWGSDAARFAEAMGLRDPALAGELQARVRAKLARQPIEAMCIDFEDGYGPRPAAEEDADARRAAVELARAVRDDEGRPVVGIRIKALAGATRERALATLEAFVTTLARAGGIPADFTITLPKVESAEGASALATALDELEAQLGAHRGSLGIELMLETPRAFLAADGSSALPSLVAATRGRCRAVHLGAYDLTAGLGVTSVHQRLDHPLCDVARAAMVFALAGTDVALVDGATTILPVAPHKGRPETLSEAAIAENTRAVAEAWRLHAAGVVHSLRFGIHASWDLHPAQLPARYGALHAFFLDGRREMTTRLRGFVERSAQAVLTGRDFDDAATGRGLLLFFLRGLACGAFDEADIEATGLDAPTLRSTFAEIAARPR